MADRDAFLSVGVQFQHGRRKWLESRAEAIGYLSQTSA